LTAELLYSVIATRLGKLPLTFSHPQLAVKSPMMLTSFGFQLPPPPPDDWKTPNVRFNIDEDTPERKSFKECLDLIDYRLTILQRQVIEDTAPDIRDPLAFVLSKRLPLYGHPKGAGVKRRMEFEPSNVKVQALDQPSDTAAAAGTNGDNGDNTNNPDVACSEQPPISNETGFAPWESSGLGSSVTEVEPVQNSFKYPPVLQFDIKFVKNEGKDKGNLKSTDKNKTPPVCKAKFFSFGPGSREIPYPHSIRKLEASVVFILTLNLSKNEIKAKCELQQASVKLPVPDMITQNTNMSNL
jgi:hypothetical protein